MAITTGFQANTTIHAAFWIYKPDPATQPQEKEQFIEINSLQKIESNPEVILGNIQSVTVLSNVVTLTVDSTSNMRKTQRIILTGLTNADFLNRAVANATVQDSVTITFPFTTADYGPAAEPAGAQALDAGDRKVWLYYAETNISTSQTPQTLTGTAAALFVYDMEALFY